MLLLAANPEPVAQPTFWENLVCILFCSAALFLYVCYYFGFKIDAQCLVLTKTTRKPCTKDGKILVGCRQHKRQKLVAWVRHLGAAGWLDPWLYRLHIVPPAFAPPPLQPAPAVAHSVAPLVVPETPSKRMTFEARIALCALTLAVLQTITALLALAVDLASGT
ncbi:hypothetical protein [Micromonospora sp. WMMC250]|uniref:hypothetical protein n=1 Tax=Micromonospora sp. WMMC250 TaxID=3014781 RepID=UPI0022B64002|nr:hypothetical protein [Micromonospora sp. WMMC250]MCZ7373281.1 hypothetical protein [Micromonospora sp. WMMC250]MCZ7373320.1 hypothetical protein [Micromonospora sp. WMMC250]MCZ7379931.1 hypothetical protein [Micromonospora sp. WMMC250]